MRRFFCISVRPRAVCCLLMTVMLLRIAAAVPISTAVEAKGVELPIIMYHSVLKDCSRSGKYIVTPETVECDLAYLKERGYTAIFASELANAVLTGGELPQKPVIITLDDGYLNNLTYVLPLLEKYDMKAVISVVGIYSECFSQAPDPNPAYAHLCWEDIEEITASGRVEIGNHTYNMHKKNTRKGARKLRCESDSDYYEALIEDVGKTQSMLEENCGILPTTFAYPYGYISEESTAILQEMGFTAMLTCTEKVNVITGDPHVLLALGRFNRPSGVSTQRFMRRLGVE